MIRYFKNKIDNIIFARWDKQSINSKRILQSAVKFEKSENVTNLYVDDKLDYGGEIVLYDIPNAVENCFTHFFSKNSISLIPKSINLIGYIEMEYYYKNISTVNISKLYVNEEYRKSKYATKMMERFIEWAKLRGIKELTLTAVAGKGISQTDLVKFYLKMGFSIEKGNCMRYKLN